MRLLLESSSLCFFLLSQEFTINSITENTEKEISEDEKSADTNGIVNNVETIHSKTDTNSMNKVNIEEGCRNENYGGERRKSIDLLLDTTNEKYSTCKIPPTWMNWLLCVSFGIEALTIGYNLSIGPIFVMDEFQKNTGMIGVLFAVGAASGTFVAIGITCTSFGKKFISKFASSPFDLCFAMFGIAVGVFVAAVPTFPVHVIGLVLLMSFNDLGATLMTELQGSITTVSNYSLLGPLGQVVRRSLNVITALTGPVLYGYYPRLPYFVAGGITLLWAILLYVAFKIRIAKTHKKLAKHTGESRHSIKALTNFTTSQRAMAMLTIIGDDLGDQS